MRIGGSETIYRRGATIFPTLNARFAAQHPLFSLMPGATARLDAWLKSHPDVYRLIVQMRIDGHEVAEIAERSQRSRRTVERVLQEFREQLQRSLGGE